MKVVHGTNRVSHVADHGDSDVLRFEQCGRSAHDVGARRSTRKSSERRPAEGGQRAISASRSHARSTDGSARCARGSRRRRPGMRAQRGSRPQERVLILVIIRGRIRSPMAVTTRQTHRRSRAATGRRRCGGGRGRSRRASAAECLDAVSPTLLCTIIHVSGPNSSIALIGHRNDCLRHLAWHRDDRRDPNDPTR